MVSAIRRVVLHQQTLARLQTLPGAGPTVTIYGGEIPDPPPLLRTPSGDPDPAGRVAPYVVLFGGVGNPDVEPDVARTVDELDWSVHLLCVSAFLDDCLDLVDRVHSWLHRWEPVHAGVAVGHLVPPPGYDPGPPRPLQTVKPIRFESPLQYRLTATAT